LRPSGSALLLGESELADFMATTVLPSPGHAPPLPPELAHASGIPGLHTPSLVGKTILIENTDGEPIGLVWERYRSLLKSS
jgi:hypothetical protein